MSGEGVISSFAEIDRRLRASRSWRERPLLQGLRLAFDPAPRVTGAIGVHEPDGWRVRIQLEGAADPQPLTFAEARKLAAEIACLCDLLEHGVPD